jgi:hypothetical protein
MTYDTMFIHMIFKILCCLFNIYAYDIIVIVVLMIGHAYDFV